MTRLLSLIAFALLIASPVLSQSIESELVERIRTLAMEYDDAGRADDYRAIEAVALALARARHGDGSLDAELLNLADDFDLIGNTDTAEVLRAIAPLTEPPPPDGNDCTDPEHAVPDHCVTADPPPTPPNELQAVISGSQVAGIQNTLATQGTQKRCLSNPPFTHHDQLRYPLCRLRLIHLPQIRQNRLRTLFHNLRRRRFKWVTFDVKPFKLFQLP